MKIRALSVFSLILTALPAMSQSAPPPPPAMNTQPPGMATPPPIPGSQPPAFGGNPAPQPPAGNTQAQIAGYWTCEAYFRNTKPGQPANAVGVQVQIQLDAQGNAWGQGYAVGSSGQFPMQFQGRWTLQGNMFLIQGQSQGGFMGGADQFTLQSQVMGNGQMAYTHQYQNGQVYASQCYKTG